MIKFEFNLFAVFVLLFFASCAQNIPPVKKASSKTPDALLFDNQEPHEYGAWYCPDNLIGFPAVDIKNWKNVPVINGRLPTKEETRTESSLIFVNKEKYPNAKPMDIELPKLARFYNKNSKKEEYVIVIQAIKFSNDNIVGFRYLNGGNGSARLSDVKFLSDDDINKISESHFITINLDINASKDKIWKIITQPEFVKSLQPIFDKGGKLQPNWEKKSKVNFKYIHTGISTSEFADLLYGNFYIQLDSKIGDYEYVEKFLILENRKTKVSEFQIMCGPYFDDFSAQKNILFDWAQKVKELSESPDSLFNPDITK